MNKNVAQVVFMRNSGFTLIELLVVVLIIAILAAVALPQYNLAVNKARFTALKSMSIPYIDAGQLYYLEHGQYPTDFEGLNIGIPADMEIVSNTSIPAGTQCAQNEDSYCCIYAPGGSYSPGVTCGRNDYSLAFVYLFKSTSFSAHGYCVAKTEDLQLKRMCQKIMGTSPSYNGLPWALNTPDGRKSGYGHWF